MCYRISMNLHEKKACISIEVAELSRVKSILAMPALNYKTLTSNHEPA